jgi:hypothetical protein
MGLKDMGLKDMGLEDMGLTAEIEPRHSES